MPVSGIQSLPGLQSAVYASNRHLPIPVTISYYLAAASSGRVALFIGIYPISILCQEYRCCDSSCPGTYYKCRPGVCHKN